MNKILIVEDEAALRSIYVMLFKAQKNYEVQEAWHGKAALEVLDSFTPDVIVLDILMPVMGGIDFLEAIDIKKKFPDTKVLVLSNLSDTQTVMKVKELGADSFLLKAATSPSELIQNVEKLLLTKEGAKAK